jgi:hypothetical protein
MTYGWAKTLLFTPALALVAVGGGCADEDSKTALNPAGPPMIRQVFAEESVLVMVGNSQILRTETQLAFGSHPDIGVEGELQDGVVTTAVPRGQKLRIVLDELLDGSSLEEIGCADSTFSAIPSGTTPDDIAECSGADRRDCKAVCTHIGPDNQPVGILDENRDGAADVFRLKEGVVKVVCDDMEMPLVLEGLNRSFWNPSGNQQIPAGVAPSDGLGPALVVVPQGLRTSAQCVIDLDDSIVDKDGNPVCAPPGGDVTKECPGEGDTSLVTFGTDVFQLRGTTPNDGQKFVQLNRTVLLQFNLDVDMASAAEKITFVDANGPVPATIAPQPTNATVVEISATGGMQPDTTYTVTVAGGSDGLQEIFGGTLPVEQEQRSFSTCLGTGGACMGNSECCSARCDVGVTNQCLDVEPAEEPMTGDPDPGDDG